MPQFELKYTLVICSYNTNKNTSVFFTNQTLGLHGTGTVALTSFRSLQVYMIEMECLDEKKELAY